MDGMLVKVMVAGVIGAVRAFRRGGPPRAPTKFDGEDPLFIG